MDTVRSFGLLGAVAVLFGMLFGVILLSGTAASNASALLVGTFAFVMLIVCFVSLIFLAWSSIIDHITNMIIEDDDEEDLAEQLQN